MARQARYTAKTQRLTIDSAVYKRWKSLAASLNITARDLAAVLIDEYVVYAAGLGLTSNIASRPSGFNKEASLG